MLIVSAGKVKGSKYCKRPNSGSFVPIYVCLSFLMGPISFYIIKGRISGAISLSEVNDSSGFLCCIHPGN